MKSPSTTWINWSVHPVFKTRLREPNGLFWAATCEIWGMGGAFLRSHKANSVILILGLGCIWRTRGEKCFLAPKLIFTCACLLNFAGWGPALDIVSATREKKCIDTHQHYLQASSGFVTWTRWCFFYSRLAEKVKTVTFDVALQLFYGCSSHNFLSTVHNSQYRTVKLQPKTRGPANKYLI